MVMTMTKTLQSSHQIAIPRWLVEQDMVLNWLLKNNVPLTRENYIALNYFGDDPSEEQLAENAEVIRLLDLLDPPIRKNRKPKG
jgi:hypothetical protein